MIEQLEDRCTPSGEPIRISASPAPILGYQFTGTVGQTFNETFSAQTRTTGGMYKSTGTYAFSQAATDSTSSPDSLWPLPPGLSLIPITGGTYIISGSPTVPGQYNVALQVTDSAGNIDTTVYQFLISPQAPAFRVSTTMQPLNALNALQYNRQTLPLGIVDLPYNATVSATNPTTDPITGVQIDTQDSKGNLTPAGSTMAGIAVTTNTNGNIYTITGLIPNPALTVSWTSGAVTVTGTPTFSAGGRNYPLFLSVTFGTGPSATTKTFNFSFGYSPQEIESAYGIDNIIFSGGIKGNGAGQTIVILEGGGVSNFVSSNDPNFANSDLNQFDQIFPGLNTFGQPGGPVFLKVDQNGQSTYNASTYPSASNVPSEEIQDIEWVHALAPMANIVDMECSGKTTEDSIQAGLTTIDNGPSQFLNLMEQQGLPAPPNGSLFVVGTSYGGDIDTAPQMTGVTYVESSGDWETTPGPTGKSGNVVLTGYTQLTQSPTSSYVSEAAVNGVTNQFHSSTQSGILQSGGGDFGSTQESYQSGIYTQFANPPSGRLGPDVSFNGAPVSGDVEFNSTINSYETSTGNLTNDSGGAPWDDAWGTSMASPSWDALFAIANQGRAAVGKPSLSGYAQALPMLYSLAGTPAFDQISTSTAGNLSPTPISGKSGGAIYNILTGLGSPVANVLIPDLAGPTLTPNSGLWAGSSLTSSMLTLTITGSDFVPGAMYSVSFNNGVTGKATYTSPTTLTVSNLTGLSGLIPGAPIFAQVTMTVTVGTTPHTTTYTDTTGYYVQVATLPKNLSNTIYVQNLYTLLLHRNPDPGAQGWVNALNAGASPASVVAGIESGSEYLNDVVTALYQHYLNRAPDPGARSLVTALENGATIEQVTADIVGSPEFFRDAGMTNSGYVNAIYNDILGRAADTTGFNGWLAALNGGESRTAVAMSFLTSAEYRQDLIAGVGWTPSSPVPNPPTLYFQGYYLTYLNRPGDVKGVAGWVAALHAGVTDQQVIADFLGSTEGYSKWS